MTQPTWSKAEIPDLSGKRALVTGVTSGLGEQTALELARRGAEVVLAGRAPDRLGYVMDDILSRVPNARLRTLVLNLADLSSVRRAADEASTYGSLDILVNNAGVMATPHRRTVDGFDLQFGTNHLGHFALTGLLLPLLVDSGNARVVTVSSVMHRRVRSVPLVDPRVHEANYSKWKTYSRSKLANLLFMFELDRRARRAGIPVVSVGAHPGYSSTKLVVNGLRMNGRTAEGSIIEAATRLLAQSPEMGALPLLMAATLPALPGGTYVGPGGPGELRGMPVIVQPSRPARNEAMASSLWEISQDATRVVYP